MSDPDHTGAPEDDRKIAAGEYVLGVLEGKERREFAQRLEREPDLAREVAFWEEKLGGLADNVKLVTPPERTWSRIETAIATPEPVRPRAGLWQSLVFWRSFAFVSAALAVACIVALGYLGTRPARDAGPLVATLGQPTGQPGFVAAVGSDGGLVIVPASLLARDQKSLELWLIPAGDRPRSLGLIASTQPVRIMVPPELVQRINTDATLAVSLEELGGSKTGAPSNDIVAVGKLTAL